MRDYATTRGIGRIISFFGWLAVAAGIIGLLALAGSNPFDRNGVLGVLGVLGGPIMIAAVLNGIFVVALGQLLQSQVDIASHTGEIVRLLRDQGALRNASTVERASSQSLGTLDKGTAPASPVDAGGTNISPEVRKPRPLGEKHMAERRQLDPAASVNTYRDTDIRRVETPSGPSFLVGRSSFPSLETAVDFIDALAPKG